MAETSKTNADDMEFMVEHNILSGNVSLIDRLKAYAEGIIMADREEGKDE